MAIIYPEQDIWFKNKAEEFVYEYLKENLSDKCVVYYNYYVNQKETDFIVFIPGEGISIIEVKGWDGNQITNIPNNTKIKYKQEGTEYEAYSPFKQCRDYAFDFNKLILEKTTLNLFISPIVCYPYMNEEIYQEKGLEIISSRNTTLLKEDFDNGERFLKILLSKMGDQGGNKYDETTSENVITVRKSIFEIFEQIESRMTTYEKKIASSAQREMYSVLMYLPKKMDETQLRSCLENSLHLWKKGIKIVVLSAIKEIEIKIYDLLNEETFDKYHYLNDEEELCFWDDKKKCVKSRVFNFECYYFECDKEQYFQVVDGAIEGEYARDILIYFDNHTGFNFNQYRIEHGDPQKHIMIKAGAGTGKTYSMISRISYLIYVNKLLPQQIGEAIIMITFTNEAADNMKDRLKKYFRTLYVLTENIYFLSIIEYIAKMNISTIHSLVRKIIQKYGYFIGIGNELSIESGVYKRRELIEKEIEKYLDQHGDKAIEAASHYEKYELVKVIEHLLNKIESKNIDLSRGYNFGKINRKDEDRAIFDLVIEVVKKIQAETIENDFEENTVQLGNLILYLDKLLDKMEQVDDLEKKVRYLFVDEFQDTDNVQIDLIKRFCLLFKFHLFVVGDIKQSIYRFRGAEQDAFKRLLEHQNEEDWETIPLRKNYRSLNELLGFFNQHFELWEAQRVLIYKEDDHLIGMKKDANKAEEKCVPYNGQEQFEDLLGKEIEAKIEKLKKGESLAVLTRKNKQIKQVKRICEERGIKIETDVADNLYTMDSTLDLYKLILALQFPNNPKYLYNLSLTHYARTIGNRVIYKHRKDPEFIVNLFGEGSEIMPGWQEYLVQLKNEPVMRVLKRIINDVKPWNSYAKEVSAKQEEINGNRKFYKRNLDALIEYIIEKSNQDYITINKIKDFLHIMIFAKQSGQRREAEDTSNKNKCKVICQTVHKSKGLEYTHVIMPYCHFDLEEIKGNELIIEENEIGVQIMLGENKIVNSIFKEQRDTEVNSKVKEEARILYVGMTRAEQTFTWFNDLQEYDEKDQINKSWQDLLGEGFNENHNV